MSARLAYAANTLTPEPGMIVKDDLRMQEQNGQTAEAKGFINEKNSALCNCLIAGDDLQYLCGKCC